MQYAQRTPADYLQFLCAKIGRKICKISGNSARPANKNRVQSAIARCAYCTMSLRAHRVSIAFRSEKKAHVQRRDHANSAPNSRERIATFPKNFGAPRAEKLRELGQRCCENRRISLQLFYESVCVLMPPKARGQRRDHAKIAKKSGEKFTN